MKLPLIEPLEQRIAPANVNPSAVSIADETIIPSGHGAATMLFYVSLDQPVPAGEQVVIHYHTVDGTALSTGTANPDYNAVTDTTLTFTAGQKSLTLPVTVNDNGVLGTEAFSVVLTSAALQDTSGNPILDGSKNPINLTELPGTLSHQAGIGTGTIQHSNSAIPTIQISPIATVTEGNNAQFTVSISAAQDYPVTVFYKTMDGSAISGTDYTGVGGGSVVIPAGSLSSTISISTTDLNGGPGDTGTTANPLSKTFNVQLQNATLADPNNDSITAAASTTGTINDVGIGHFHLVGTQSTGASPTVTVNENAGTVTFTVQRTDNLGVTATVDFTTSDGTDAHRALAGTDYSTVHGTLTFAPGQSQQTVTVPIIDAGKTTGTTDFNVTISNAQNAALSSDAGQDPTHTGAITGVVTINDNDNPPSHFSIVSTTVNEAAGKVTIVVNRTGDLSDVATVDYTTMDGTALSGVDYTGNSSAATLTFAAFQGQATFTIPIADIHKTTGTSQFTVNLANPTNADVTTGTGTVTINDNDVAPSKIAFNTTSTTVNEADGVATIVVTRTGDLTGAASITYTTADGNALKGTDYATTTGTVSFPADPNPADTSQSETFTIPLLDPQKMGGGSVEFAVSLSNPINTAIQSGQGSTQVNIIDNDTTTYHLTGTGTSSSVTVDAPTAGHTGSATFTVTRSGGDLTQPATIHFTTVDGTAHQGTNYTPISGDLAFPANVTSETITVQLPEQAYNQNEQFTLQLSNSQGGNIPSPNGVGTVIIDGPSHFAVQSISANENGVVMVEVTRSGDTSGTATVTYKTVDGTALAGTDYQPVSTGTLTFNPGDTELFIPISLLNPQKTGSPQFTVVLSTPTNADIATGTGTVTINDAITHPNFIVLSGDNGTTTTTVDDVHGTQGSVIKTATFTVTRTGDISQAASVHYTTVDGTAKAGTNYQTMSGDLLFAAGQAALTISVPVLEQAYNGNLQFQVQLSNAQGAGLTTGTGTVVIDGPSHYTLTGDGSTTGNPAGVTVNETDGKDGKTQVYATFTITRTGDLSQPGTVAYTTVDGSAVHGVDYATTSGVLQFPANTATQTIQVPILEPQKSGVDQFTIALSSPTDGDIAVGTGTVTINDSLAHPSFLNLTGTTSNTVIVEAGSTAGTATFTVTRTGDLTQQATVDYTTVDGSAVGGKNYTATHGTLTFQPDSNPQDKSQTATITIPIPVQSFLGDSSFSVQLSNPQNTAITTGTGIVAVDGPSHFSLVGDGKAGNPTAVTVNEADGKATFTITRQGDTSGIAFVNYSTSDGTAVGGTDYTATTGTLEFDAGQTSKTITIPIIDAQKLSGSGQFTLTLSGANNADITPGQGAGTVTINDNDTSAFKIAGADGSATVSVVDMSGKNAVFTITRTGNLSQPATVHFATVDGTAIGGAAGAYTPMSGDLHFKANQTSQTISIPILSQPFTSSEQFTVQLSNASGTALANGTGTVVINSPSHYAIAAATVNENAGTVTLKVTRTGDLTSAGSVSFATADGTAVHGVDYTAENGMVVFPKVTTGAQTQTEFITIPILDAQKTGTTSNFSVNLSNAVGGDIATASSTITINDNDTHVNSVTITGKGTTSSTVTVDDKNQAPGTTITTVDFTVTRTGDLSQPASVDFTTIDGTAIHGVNYTTTTGTVTFAANSATGTISIPVLAEPYNGNLSFTVQLSNPQGVGISAGTGTVVIDNPTHLAVTAGTGNTATVTVDDSSASTATITVVRTGDLTQASTVMYTTKDGTATAGTNYQPQTGTLTFAAGSPTAQIMVPIIGTAFTGNEQFTVQISSPTGADITTDTATVIIGVPSHFQLQGDGSTTAVAVNESDSNHKATTATFTVTRTGDTTGSATVHYATSDGTGVAGTDYTATSGTLTFGPGVMSETITIPIIDAQKTSGSSLFHLTLSSPTNADIPSGQGAGTVTITDADTNPNFLSITGGTGSTTTFTVDDVSGNSAKFLVTRTGDLTNAASVDFTTVDGSAIAGTNYTPEHGTISFAANSATGTVTYATGGTSDGSILIPLIAQPFSGNLSFTVQLSNSQGTGITAGSGTAVIDAPNHFTISAAGNSNATVTVDDVSGTAGSQIGTATFLVTRSGDGAATQSATVVVSTADGTATSGTNYTALNQTLTFAPGVTQETITVPVLAQPYTGNEQFTVQLSSPTAADVTTGTGTVIIDGPSHFSIGPSSFSEHAGKVTLTVTRTGDLSAAASVGYSTVNGTSATVASGNGIAVAGTDFTATSGTLNFAPGSSTASIPLTILDTNKSGQNEQFFVQLTNGQNADIVTGQGMGTITINEDDSFTAKSNFSIVGPATVNETDHTATYTVTRTGNLTTAATLNFATTDGSTTTNDNPAVAGTDYKATSGTLTFPAIQNTSGTQTETITVPLINNNHHAKDGDYTLNVTSAQNAGLPTGGYSLVTTIHDDAALPTVSIGNATVTKSTTTATTETFTVTLSAPDNTDDITVNFSTLDGTAKAGTDYTAITNQTVTIPKGSTSATVTVPILADNVLNPTTSTDSNNVTPGSESFTATLSNATTVNGTSPAALTFTNSTATGTITDNLTKEIVSVSNATIGAGGKEAFTVNLTQPFSQDIILSYSTVDGTAIDKTGYTGVQGGTITIPAGQTTETILIQTLDPGLYGNPLTFTLNSSFDSHSPVPLNVTLANAKSGTATATATIIEGETITIGNPTVVAGSDEVFLVTLSRASSNPITFNYTTVDGTALAGTGKDYTATINQQFTIPAGQTTALIDIPTMNNSVSGSNVYFTVQLSNPTSGVTLANANSAGIESGTGTILSTHTDGLSISNGVTKSEPTVTQNGSDEFTVTLAKALSTAVTFSYATQDGTGANAAHAGTDYVATSGTVTIKPGDTSATIDIPTLSSGINGPDRNFSVQLSGPSSTAFISNATGTGTVPGDMPTVSIGGSTTVTQSGSATTASFDVTLLHASTQPITVSYTTVDGTGSGGATSTGPLADFTATSGSFTFTPGQTKMTITVPILASTLAENDRSFTVQLSDPINTSIQTGSISTTIHSDSNNKNLGLDIDNPTVLLGAPGTQGTETFNVFLSKASSNTITVHYTTVDGTAHSTGALPDYQSTTGTLTFQPGQTSATISVPVSSTGAAMAKNFLVELSNPTDSSGASDIVVDQGLGTGTIVNNSALPGLNINDVKVDQTGQNATFTVSLSQVTTSDVTFQYQTVDGTAKAGIDYTAQHNSLTIPAGTSSITFSVPLKDLGFNEASNQFSVQLFDPSSNTVLGDATGTATITHSADPKVGISVANVQTSIANGVATNVSASSITFTATLSAKATSDVTFMATPYQLFGLGVQTAVPGSLQNVQTSSGTQTELVGGNFLAQGVQVTIPAGSTSATFTFPIAEVTNGSFQPDHSFGVNFTDISANAIAQTPTAIGTILDNGITITKHQAVWHDIDGDTVTLKVSKGDLTQLSKSSTSGELVFSSPNAQTGGVTLEVLDLSGHLGAFAGANVSVMAQQVTLLGANTVIGNGTVDVGYIAGNDNVNNELQSSNARDLGFVTVDGDLAKIDVGDLFNTPGLLGLNVHSLGANLSTLPAGSNLTTSINNVTMAVSNILAGGVSKVNISGNLVGQLQVFGDQFGNIGSLKVGGTLTGNVVFTGMLRNAVIGSIDGTGGNGEIQGQSDFDATIHSITVLGSVIGGAGTSSGQIQAPTISNVQVGKLIGGGGTGSASISANIIRSVTVSGGVVGGQGLESGAIVANTGIGVADVGSLTAGAGQASGSILGGGVIEKVTVRGSIDGTNAAAVTTSNGLGDITAGEIVSVNGTIGSVHVMGNIIGGSQDRAGEIIAEAGGINSVIVDGSLVGGSGTNSGSIEAQGTINSVTVAGNVVGASGTGSAEIFAAVGISNVTIRGQLEGGTGAKSGSVQAGVQIGKLLIGTAGQEGDAIIGSSGQDSGWVTASSLGQAVIQGNVAGGSGAHSGDLQISGAITSVTVNGNLTGNTGDDSGAILSASIGSILVNGDVTGGDGANSGFIQSTNLSNHVTIDGSLTGGTGSQSGAVMAGSIGSILVQGGVVGGSGGSSGFIEAGAQIKQVTLGTHQDSQTPIFSLIGSTGAASGSVEAASIGKALVYGIAGGAGGASGGFAVSGAIGSIEVNGDLQGGSSGNSGTATTKETGFIVAGSISSLIIDGNVTSGVDNGAGLSQSGLIDASGAIKSAVVRGAFGNTNGSSPVMITAGGKTTNGVALGHVEIDGDINNAEILAGISTDSTLATFQSATASIGAILIKSASVSGLHIAAGVTAGTDGVYGTADDTEIAETSQDKAFARIASIIFSKTVSAPAVADSIEALEVDSIKTGTQKPISNPGDFANAQQIDGLPNFIAFTVPRSS